MTIIFRRAEHDAVTNATRLTLDVMDVVGAARMPTPVTLVRVGRRGGAVTRCCVTRFIDSGGGIGLRSGGERIVGGLVRLRPARLVIIIIIDDSYRAQTT